MKINEGLRKNNIYVIKINSENKSQLESSLSLIDERNSYERLRTGVQFVAEGQKTDQEAQGNASFNVEEINQNNTNTSNSHISVANSNFAVSDAYECFLTCLGSDWSNGVRGIKDNLYVVYAHIANKLPTTSSENRVFERKRLIGNDPVLVLWLMNPNVDIDNFVTKFNAIVFILIEKPNKNQLLKVKCYLKEFPYFLSSWNETLISLNQAMDFLPNLIFEAHRWLAQVMFKGVEHQTSSVSQAFHSRRNIIFEFFETFKKNSCLLEDYFLPKLLESGEFNFTDRCS